MDNVTVLDFLDEFYEALQNQLTDDQERWGNAWLEKRTIRGQETRIYDRIWEYYTAWAEDGVPIPWLKVIGNAYIAWIRETHPELWEE